MDYTQLLFDDQADASLAPSDFDLYEYSTYMQPLPYPGHHHHHAAGNSSTDGYDVDEDLYLAEEDSPGVLSVPVTTALILPSNATNNGNDNNSTDEISNNGNITTTTTNSRRLERRGHTKSRRGCFSCKRRRIKCQETRPQCGHCRKHNMPCEYPVAPLVNHQPQHQIPLFSLQDMRLFQHFMMQCAGGPSGGQFGSQSLWTHEIPCLSHNHDYLMHALLAMAASDLVQHDASLATAAADHRLRAIRAIKRTLAEQQPQEPYSDNNSGSSSSSSGSVSPGNRRRRSSARHSSGGASEHKPSSSLRRDNSKSPTAPPTPLFEEEGNALMATCFALAFQSVALDDGMAEYMTFVRGLVMVAVQMHRRGARIMFGSFGGGGVVTDHRHTVPPKAPKEVDSHAALAAVQTLAPLCAGDDVATAYHALLLQMAEALALASGSPNEILVSSMTRHYAWWMQLPLAQFRQVIDVDDNSNNNRTKRPVFQVLATHWIALKQTISMSVASSSTDGMDAGLGRWLRHLNKQVAPAFRAYNAWPMQVEAELAAAKPS